MLDENFEPNQRSPNQATLPNILFKQSLQCSYINTVGDDVVMFNQHVGLV
jgi:hypothetical protein